MANRFWLGGTGNWDGTTASSAHWGTASGGGTTPTTGPGTSDVAIFDGASGGGTVTVTGTIAIQSLTTGAFTGTLDFSANNNNVTLSAAAGMNATGSGTRTINLGNGNWNLTSATGTWDFTTITGLTFNANSSVLNFSGNSASGRTITLGAGLTYSTINVAANTTGGTISFNSLSVTIATLNIVGPRNVLFPITTYTITNNSITSSPNAVVHFRCSTANNPATLSLTNNNSMAWCAFTGIVSVNLDAVNSFDLGSNTLNSIRPPSWLVNPGMSGGMA